MVVKSLHSKAREPGFKSYFHPYGCVIWGTLLKLSGPSFSYQHTQYSRESPSEGVQGLCESIHSMCLEQRLEHSKYYRRVCCYYSLRREQWLPGRLVRLGMLTESGHLLAVGLWTSPRTFPSLRFLIYMMEIMTVSTLSGYLRHKHNNVH